MNNKVSLIFWQTTGYVTIGPTGGLNVWPLVCFIHATSSFVVIEKFWLLTSFIVKYVWGTFLEYNAESSKMCCKFHSRWTWNCSVPKLSKGEAVGHQQFSSAIDFPMNSTFCFQAFFVVVGRFTNSISTRYFHQLTRTGRRSMFVCTENDSFCFARETAFILNVIQNATTDVYNL